MNLLGRLVMKYRTLGMVVVLIAAFGRPSTVSADTKSGEAKLLELTGFDVAKKGLKVSLGGMVKAECNYYIIPDFFGRKVISVGARIKNTAKKPMYYGYYVAFFDRDKKLIATSSYEGKFARLEPGKETNIGNVVGVPRAQLGKIAFYQVTLLEDEKEFGS
jgi:hypothetical protein